MGKFAFPDVTFTTWRLGQDPGERPFDYQIVKWDRYQTSKLNDETKPFQEGRIMVKIRRAQQTDAEELARLSSQLGYPISGDELSGNLAALDDDGDHAVFVAEKDLKGLAGFGHVFLTRRLFLPPFAELGGLVVDQEYRGEGLGGILLEAAEGWALEKGLNEMRVRSNVLRENARGFYLGKEYHDSKKQNVFIKSLTRELD